MKNIFLISSLLLLSLTTFAQKYHSDVFEIDDISKIRGLHTANGTVIRYRPTGAEYFVQSTNPATVDSVTVIQLAEGNYAVLKNTTGQFYLEDFGLTEGTGLTKEQQRQNWRRFKAALNFVKAVGVNYNLSSRNKNTYEFYLDNSSGYVNTSNFKAVWDFKGSEFYFFPKVTTQYFEQVFTMGNYETDLVIKNAKFYTYRPSLETYTATLKPSGNLTEIVLTSSDIRPGFNSDVIGSQIYVSYDYDQEADTITVTGYDSGTKTLTLQRNLNLASATTNDAGWVGLKWNPDQLLDTINAYSLYWLLDNTGISFLSAVPTTVTKKNNFEFYNVTADGFYDFMYKANGEGKILMEGCDLSGFVTVITNFQNSAVYSEVIVRNCFIHDTGFESIGQNPGNAQANGDRYNGGTIYTHPNTKLLVEGTRFDNAGVAIRQYSSTGDKPMTDYKFHSEIRNCEFINQRDQYQINTSFQIPTLIKNCYISSGAILANYNTTIDKCVIDSAVISPSGETLITDCKITGTSTFTFSTSIGSKTTIENTTIDILTNYPTSPSYLWGIPSGSGDTLIMNNVKILKVGSGSTSYVGLMQNAMEVVKFKDVVLDLNTGDYLFARWGIGNSSSSFENVTVKSGLLAGFANVSTGIKPFKAVNVRDNNGLDLNYGDFVFMDLPFPNKSNLTNVAATSLTYSSITNLTLPTANTIVLNPVYDYHTISGTAKRIIFGSSTSSWGQHLSRKGLLVLHASNTTSIPAYNSATADSTSNFLFDLSLAAGESKQVYFDPYAFATGTNAVSSMTGENIGTTTTNLTQRFNGQINPGGDSNNGTRIIPNTVVVYVDGVEFGIDDGKGNISGALGTGVISYLKNHVELTFNTAPTAGLAVTIDADYVNRANGFHYFGAFIDPANVPDVSGIVIPTGTPNTLSAWDGSGNATSSNVTIDVSQTDLTTPYYIQSKGFVTPNRVNENRGVMVTGVDVTRSTSDGAVEITIPGSVGFSYYMDMEVTISGGSTLEERYRIQAAYTNPLTLVSNHWSATAEGISTRMVRWGNDGTNFKIWIGELNSTLNNSVIAITYLRIYDQDASYDVDYDAIINGITITSEASAFNTVTRSLFPVVIPEYSVLLRTNNFYNFSVNNATYISSLTGAIEITLPTLLFSEKIALTIEVKSTGYKKRYYLVGQVGSSGSGTWNNATAIALGNDGSKGINVRFGNDGTNPKIWIGELTGESYSELCVEILNIEIAASGSDAVNQPAMGLYQSSTSISVTSETTAFNTVNSTSDTRLHTGDRILNGSQSIGTTSAPDASLALDVVSTTKGFAPPRMTTAQRTAISSPVDGSVVYDTDIDQLYLRSNSSWVALQQGTKSWGGMYINDTDSDTVTIASATAAQAVDLTQGQIQNFSYSSGTLTYTGTETAIFQVTVTLSFSHSVNNTLVEGWIYKNDTEQPNLEFHRKIGTGGDVGSSSLVGFVQLATNDTLKLYFNSDNDGDIIIENGNVNVVKIQ